jgi:hypothetical protein
MNWIIYSHTEYLDILNIQTHYLQDISDKKLFINKTNNLPQNITEGYKEIFFYDDSLPYASRILSLKDTSIQEDYILLTHDIDILVSKDVTMLKELFNFARDNNLDRIDLQYYHLNSSDYHLKFNDLDFYLTKQNNPNHAIYNVNPSIWKLETLMDIMSNFPNENYRTIEKFETQVYSQKFSIYKMYCSTPVECGYFKCLPFYQFIHITHGGGLLPLGNNGLEGYLQDEYLRICQNFKFNSNRSFRLSRW